MQVITIAGNIGKSAEVRTTGNSKTVAGFSVAVSEGRDKPTTWFDCSIWGKRGESLAQYLTKGSKVTVMGKLTTREHEGKTYLGCMVSEVTLQGGKSDSASQRGSDSGYGRNERASTNDYGQAPKQDFELDDEIPF